MTALGRKLGALQAIALSVSIIAPTAAMALNVSLTVQSAGPAAPLAFTIGTFPNRGRGGVLCRVQPAYCARQFGLCLCQSHFRHRCGFIAGWTLLLTYVTYAGGASCLVGSFVHAAAQRSDRCCHVLRISRHATCYTIDPSA